LLQEEDRPHGKSSLFFWRYVSSGPREGTLTKREQLLYGKAHRGTVDELLSSAIENGSKATKNLGCACAPDRRKPIQPAGEATLRKFLSLFPACFSEVLEV
jgi:hypothetical protein